MANSIQEDLSFTGKPFKRVEPLKSKRKMPAMAGDTLKVMFKYLSKEIGKFNTFILLLKSWTIDLIFDPPKWDPGKFKLDSKEREELYKKKFKIDGLYLIPVHRNLTKKYGEKKANEILFRVTIIAGIPFLANVFKPIPNIKHIDEFRQQMSDYLGGIYDDIKEEWISTDGTEVRYKFHRCPHIEIWKAYGLHGLACGACMADHVIFDNNIPQIVFSRTSTISLGDKYCDHAFRIRLPQEEEWFDTLEQSTPEQEKRYGDAHKIPKYKAREEIRKWRHHFLMN